VTLLLDSLFLLSLLFFIRPSKALSSLRAFFPGKTTDSVVWVFAKFVFYLEGFYINQPPVSSLVFDEIANNLGYFNASIQFHKISYVL
jgi:hypothetical protein